MRSSLSSLAHLMRDPDPAGAQKRARDAWHDEGAVVLLPETLKRLNRLDRELVVAICNRIYGIRQ